MTYERFEDLPIWQKAAELYERTEELLEDHNFKATSGFRDLLDRAALSAPVHLHRARLRGRGAFHAHVTISPGRQGQRVDRFEISNFKFEICRGELFTTITRLGGLAPKFKHQRPTSPD